MHTDVLEVTCHLTLMDAWYMMTIVGSCGENSSLGGEGVGLMDRWRLIMQSGVRRRSLVWKNGYVGRRKIFLGIQNYVLNGEYINIVLLKIKFLRIMACSIE